VLLIRVALTSDPKEKNKIQMSQVEKRRRDERMGFVCVCLNEHSRMDLSFLFPFPSPFPFVNKKASISISCSPFNKERHIQTPSYDTISHCMSLRHFFSTHTHAHTFNPEQDFVLSLHIAYRLHRHLKSSIPHNYPPCITPPWSWAHLSPLPS